MEEQYLNNIEQNASNEKMVVTREGEYYLKKTSNWSMFLAVMMFISIGFSFITFIVYAVSGNVSNMLSSLFEMALEIAPAIFLVLFASRTKKALKSKDQDAFSSSLLNLKRFWTYAGILLIVSLVFISLLLIVLLVAACVII